jgi:DASH complex subunit DAD2
MASSTSTPEHVGTVSADSETVKIPKPKGTDEGEGEQGAEKKSDSEPVLPQTLVRIPTEHAPMLQQQSSGGGGSGES